VGEASVEIADYFETDKFTLRYFIIDLQSGARTEVFMPGPANGPVNKNFRTGNIISVHGSRRPNGRDIDFQDLDLLEAYPDNILVDRAPDAEAPIATPVTREILTLLVDFKDAVVYDYITPANTPNGATLQAVTDRMFTETKNVAHFYDTASLGTLTIPSSAPGIPGEIPVYGPYEIDYNYLNSNPGSCTASTWVDAALDEWELATGQSRSSYKHHSLILPNYWDYTNGHCTWGGLAQLGCGDNCWALSRDPVSILHGVIIHEIGHNFDMNHARTDTNNDGTSDCEYCDSSDFMGGSRNWMKFNPPHFEFKGWYDPDSYELRTITPTSTLQEFHLLPVDEEDTEWPGLRALKTTRSDSTNYYFSFRQQTGHYNNVTSSYTTGVSLHWRNSTSYSYFYRMIAPGEVFVDATNNLLVHAVGPTTIDNVEENDTTDVFTLRVCNTTCATLLPPVNLVAAGTTPISIELNWGDYTYNEDGFTVEYSPDGSSWSTLATIPANATSYLHSGLSGDSTFHYRVRAYRGGENSEWSNTAIATTPPVSGIIGFPIVTGNDDTVQFTSGGLNGAMWLTAPYIFLGFDTFNNEHNDEGLRFQNISIPQGSTINNAYIKYRAYGAGSGDTTVTFRTEDIDDAPAFSAVSNDLTSRTFSPGSVNWTLGAWNNGSYYQSPSLSTLVQPMIDRAGWNGGNSLLFITQGTQSGTHRAYSYDTSPDAAPELVIDFTWTPAIPSPPNATAVSDITNNSFQANWDSSVGATGYRLDVSTNGSFNSFVSGYNDLDVGDVILESVTGLSPDTMYYYRVRANNIAGTSGNSNTISLTTSPAVAACNVNTVPSVTEIFDITHEACEMLILGPDFVAGSGATVSVNSGWEIDFLPGFIVETGATLRANVCGQSLCMISAFPMPDGCHSCVDQICAIDSACCNSEFGASCLEKVSSVCGLVCE